MPKSNIFHSRRARQAAERFLKRQKHIVRNFRQIRCKKKPAFNNMAVGSLA